MFEYFMRSDTDRNKESEYYHDGKDGKVVGRWGVRGISLAVKHGERFVIMDSKEKTSDFIIRAMTGEARTIAGEIIIDGHNS